MKTLGQVMYEAWRTDLPEFDNFKWKEVPDSAKVGWETAAKAVATTVRAETLKEVATILDGMEDEWGYHCAAAIRSLALEKP